MQHILSALPEMMCQECSRNVSPTASPALHLPLTAMTSILVIRNALLHWHEFTPPDAITRLHRGRLLRRPRRDAKFPTTDNIHACLASICQPKVLSAGHCARRMLASVKVGTDPGSKLATAQKSGTGTLSEAEFLNFLDKAGGSL